MIIAREGQIFIAFNLNGELPSIEVEWSRRCQRVLRARMSEGFLDTAPVHGDVSRFQPTPDMMKMTDGLIGGFPRQEYWTCRETVFLLLK